MDRCVAIIVFFFSLSLNINSQISVGAFGGVGLPAILNQDNYGQKEMNYAFSIGTNYGVRLGYKPSPSKDWLLSVAFRNQGQDYEDNFNGANFKKQIDLDYIYATLGYKFDLKYDNNTGLYGIVGLRVGFLQSAQLDHQINSSGVSFLEFVLNDGGSTGAQNAHESTLTTLGEPSDFEDLYKSSDIGVLLGLGHNIEVSERFHISVEGILSQGITDINSEPYRLENRENIYKRSLNTYMGIQLGFNYYISDPKKTSGANIFR